MAQQQDENNERDDASQIEPDTLRQELVAKLRASGVFTDPAVERAISVVPRHLFLPEVPVRDAYADIAVPTHWQNGVPISSASQPAIVAIMLQQLALAPGMRVLEIGAGAGYNAALLTELVGPTGSVTTLDLDAEIVAEARAHLDTAGYSQTQTITADGSDGWAANAPYHRIILTVGVSDISPAWFDQLIEGGLLVLPLWLGCAEASVAFRKRNGALVSESLAPCSFMRFRGAEASAEEWATLPNRRRLFAEGASEIADQVAALLQMRPRRRLFVHAVPAFLRAMSPFLHYLGLRGYRLVSISSDRKRPQRRLSSHWGVYLEGADGPSLALFGNRLPLLLVFGGRAAEHTIEMEVARWQPSKMRPLEQWRITAYPSVLADAIPPAPEAIRRARRYFVFDVTLTATAPSA